MRIYSTHFCTSKFLTRVCIKSRCLVVTLWILRNITEEITQSVIVSCKKSTIFSRYFREWARRCLERATGKRRGYSRLDTNHVRRDGLISFVRNYIIENAFSRIYNTAIPIERDACSSRPRRNCLLATWAKSVGETCVRQCTSSLVSYATKVTITYNRSFE